MQDLTSCAIIAALTSRTNTKWEAWAARWLCGSDRTAAAAESAREDAGIRKAAALASQSALHAAEADFTGSPVTRWAALLAAQQSARASLNYSAWDKLCRRAREAARAGAPGEAISIQTAHSKSNRLL